MATWATLETVRRDWPGAPSDDDVLDALIAAAQRKCEAFAPTLEDPDDPPAGFDTAVALACRDVWASARRDGDVIGFDSYAVRVRPLSVDVCALLRPPTGRPGVG